MLVDSDCADHIVTIIDAFLDFVPIQSVIKNPNGEASRLVRRCCAEISIPSNTEFQFKPNKDFCVCLTILQTSCQSKDARKEDVA